ncbi:hypothetical protein EYF80_043704 [Liparis tanakae]|uniref:Uncharacterized protein n=1 Tax=Liparis tanakae TaxID=230148 RepID=A0A4Z2FXR9_9TELE|nr:hypothetical protein EYF80_043704 [Liparis tanakae]
MEVNLVTKAKLMALFFQSKRRQPRRSSSGLDGRCEAEAPEVLERHQTEEDDKMEGWDKMGGGGGGVVQT